MAYTTAQAPNAYLDKPKVSTGDPGESDLSLAAGEARNVGKMLAEIRSEIIDLSVRLRGPEAQTDDDCANERETFREGLVGDVRRVLSDARDTASDTLAMLRRLRSIV